MSANGGVATEGARRPSRTGELGVLGDAAGISGSRSRAGSSAVYGSATATSTSSSIASRRTHAYLGTDDRIVLDIGSRVLKAGYSGEARPRLVVSSSVQATLAEEIGRAGSSRLNDQQDSVWTLDTSRQPSQEHRQRAQYELKARLTRLLRRTIYESLAADPKGKRIVIVENVFLPEIVKQALVVVLFGNMQAAAVSFVPSHLTAAVATGRSSLVAIDVGHEQATLVPIYYWRPLAPRYVATTTRAGRRLRDRLRALLLHFGTFVASPAPRSASGSARGAKRERISTDQLSPDFLDDIIAKAVFVAEPSSDTKGDIRFEQRQARPGLPDQQWIGEKPFSQMREEGDEVFMQALEARYRSDASCRDMTIRIPAPPHPLLQPAMTPATMGSHDAGLAKSPGVIIVPGWIRQRAAEVLFEPGDAEEPSLTQMILDIILKLPVDIRTTLAGNIFVHGGLAMLPGLAHRLRLELVQALQDAEPKTESVAMQDLALTLPRVGPRPTPRQKLSPVKGNDNEVGTDDQAASSASQARTLRRWTDKYAPISQLAAHIAVINDHAPRLNDQGEAVGGHAPAFAPNLASWIGASLVCSLRIESINSTTRETWDSARAKQEAAAASTSPEKTLSQEPSAKAQSQDNTSTSPRAPPPRPLLGSGRGSFLGTVGGLDTGSYGPLSAGAQHGAFSGSDALRSPQRR